MNESYRNAINRAEIKFCTLHFYGISSYKGDVFIEGGILCVFSGDSVSKNIKNKSKGLVVFTVCSGRKKRGYTVLLTCTQCQILTSSVNDVTV